MKKPAGSFQDYLKSAENKVDDKNSLEEVVNQAFSKVMNIQAASDELKQLVRKIILFSKMLKAYFRGVYTAIPWRSVVALTASLIYFINPFDLVSDLIPGIGLMDDLAVVLWVSNYLGKDLHDFEEYLKTNNLSLDEQEWTN